jgi:FhuF-like iron-sulfur protein
VTPSSTLTGLGPFFEVDFHDRDAVAEPPWRPLADVLDDGPVLRDRVARVRHVLAAGGEQADGAVELRVAASVTHLGIAARLISPVLAVAVGSGAVLDLDGSWWQPTLGGAVPLSVCEPLDARPDDLAAAVLASLAGPLRRLDAAAARFSLSRHVRWGNVASGVNGAATMLAAARPEWTARTGALVAALFARSPLRGTATTVDGRFRRRSCCLIYRAAPGHAGPKCGDCVLD